MQAQADHRSRPEDGGPIAAPDVAQERPEHDRGRQDRERISQALPGERHRPLAPGGERRGGQAERRASRR